MWLTKDRLKRLHHYDTLVKEHEELLAERDRLMIELEASRRVGGLTPHGASIGPSVRIAFPHQILADGAIRPIKVVDVGAQVLANEEHAYQALVDAGAATIVGFEPLSDAASARSVAEPHILMLEYFIGDGSRRSFHVNRFDATSSLLPSNLVFLDRFEALSTMCETLRTIEVETVRLDDIPEVLDADFLKLDVQGGELDVLKGAGAMIERVVAVHCEVEFSPVYVDQPLYGDIDSHLRSKGFELIDIKNAGYSTVKGLPRPVSKSHLLWGEAVYMRRPEKLVELGSNKILSAAFIAHVNYGMYDIAASFLNLLTSPLQINTGKQYGDWIVKVRASADNLTS